ncbi:MAG: tRNA uridine-5-carboxymethylaminomethyl(34) synthesis GTPase MnmE [Gammaproteobacteria bacterium]|nr:tRNA uridine-5-carboxymethylaminomethyl(34) synthesis GTPase MnmE [Gammaproteobacteria bacterium]
MSEKPPVIEDTIVAQATPPGRGGIGVVRLSGDRVQNICQAITGLLPEPRFASISNFIDSDESVIDRGLVIYFPKPASFTGEHVLELHGHGGPVVMKLLIDRCQQLGARIAAPGEFSERAFLNGKIDLSQAEAIADLIDSASKAAAKSAVRSMQGEFSKRIEKLTENVTLLRMYVEAAIDFPEEEIDFLGNKKVQGMLESILAEFDDVTKRATQGALLREGASLVLAGRPNAGKSSLMNSLTGKEVSIVTNIAGTTRDIVDNYIHLDGLPLRLIDTAGLHTAGDVIEIEGVKRAHSEIRNADHVILIVDCFAHRGEIAAATEELRGEVPGEIPVTVVVNKIDLNQEWQQEVDAVPEDWIPVSAKTGEGMKSLRGHLKQALGFITVEGGTFIARARHLDALTRARASIETGERQLMEAGAGELLAEELKLCQQALGEITGIFTSDDLLGMIFSSFCIGK